jgi:hypothetical protein
MRETHYNILSSYDKQMDGHSNFEAHLYHQCHMPFRRPPLQSVSSLSSKDEQIFLNRSQSNIARTDFFVVSLGFVVLAAAVSKYLVSDMIEISVI